MVEHAFLQVELHEKRKRYHIGCIETTNIFQSSIVPHDDNLLDVDPSSYKDKFIDNADIIAVDTERNLESTGIIPHHQKAEEKERGNDSIKDITTVKIPQTMLFIVQS